MLASPDPGQMIAVFDALTDHVLSDIGMDRPGYKQPTWHRYIHR